MAAVEDRATAPAPQGWREEGELVAVPCALMRGGTSKAVFLEEAVVPSDPDGRARFLLALMGSPDPRQTDGLGGADLLTSKVAIIGPPSRPGADLDYTFAQVSVRDARVDYDINCGNISAAVGVYAVERGLVTAQGGVATVRINNVNTRRVFYAEVPVAAGHARVEGNCKVDGVPGSGAEILLDLRETVGTATGGLLPTGSPADTLEVPGIGPVEVSIVDIAYLCVAVRASDLGVPAGALPVTPDDELLGAVDRLQRAAARHLGLAEDTLVPVPMLVSEPHDYRTLTAGELVAAEDIDLVAEVIGGQPLALHKAFPGGAGVTLAVTARLPGSVAAVPGGGGPVRIGHPSGRTVVDVALRTGPGGEVSVERAAYSRTARRLMDGTAYLPAAALGRVPEALA